MPSVEEEVIMF